MASGLENSCSICFNVYNDSDHQAVDLPCSHSFCITCLTQLRSTDSHTCPVCREDWQHLQFNMTMKTTMMTSGSNDGKSAVVQTDSTGDEQNCDFKAQVKKKAKVVCPDHALPFWFWCEECKEFSCRKCVIEKQRKCIFLDIEDVLPNIKSYLNSQIETIVSEVQNDADDLNTALTHATETLSSVMTHIDALLKYQHDLTAHVNLLEQMICKRNQDITAVKKYSSVIKNVDTVTEIQVIQESVKTLDELQQHNVPSMPSFSQTLQSDIICTFMAVADHSTGSLTDAATAEAAALLKEGGDWSVDTNNWRAAVLALAERRPKQLTLRAARDGKPESFKVNIVATIAKAATDCSVQMFFLDTFFTPDNYNTDRHRLELALANTSLKLIAYYGHLDAAGIARLPRSVTWLGLAIGSAEDAAAVSATCVWEGLLQLDVAVSTSVAPQHLRPLPCVSSLRVHFYGISDGQVDLIRPAVDALVSNKRLHCFCLPKCQLSAGGARRLAHQLRGVAITHVTIDLSDFWQPGEEERQSVTDAFRNAGNHSVQWDMKWLFGEK